jgi:hypothetical protein
LVEQVTLNHRVGGSSPSQPTYKRECGHVNSLKTQTNLSVATDDYKYGI